MEEEKLKANEYRCELCRGVFGKGWTVAEAEKELKENFDGQFVAEECELVCDDCYKKIGFGESN